MAEAHELLDDVLAQLRDAGLDPDTPLEIGVRTRCTNRAAAMPSSGRRLPRP